MLNAKSWEQLHVVLANHGLCMHPRTNGLVISAEDGTTGKASSVAREFSNPRLEQRFGPSQAAPEQQVLSKPARQYQKRPLAPTVDTTELYARYRVAQAEARDGRAREREQARARKERRIEAAKRSVQLKRAALRLASMPRPAKKLMYGALTHALREEIAAIKGVHRRERQAIDRQHRRSQWTDWLRHAAEMGDFRALTALRARNRHAGLAGNMVTGDAPPRQPVRPSGHDSITRKGTIIYRVGASAIRDDGARLKVSLGADQAALQCALRMALARYGDRIAVNGSDAFKERIVIASVADGLRVAFADGSLEQRRLQLLRLATSRNKPATEGACQGLGREDQRGPGGATATPSNERGDERPNPEPNFTKGANGSREATTCTKSAEIRTVRDSASDAAARYIAEREQKRINGFDIPKHARYTAFHAGPATYAGTRRVDGHALALLRQGDQVMVLDIDEATARRLKRLQLVASVGVSAKGVVKAKGRSR